MKSPTAEIREIRHRLAAQFDNDVDRIYEDLKRKQRESGASTFGFQSGRRVMRQPVNNRLG